MNAVNLFNLFKENFAFKTSLWSTLHYALLYANTGAVILIFIIKIKIRFKKCFASVSEHFETDSDSEMTRIISVFLEDTC